MELLVGPAFTIDVPSSPPPPAYDDGGPPSTSDGAGEIEAPKSFFGIGGQAGFFTGESSASSSSIGTPDDDSDDEKDEEEVESKLKGLGSLDSLEDSLPIKKGLSNHFAGKSKSYTDLSQVSEVKSVKELQKQENPFNKRRRVQIASKWSSRKSSFYAWSNPQSMPLLPVVDEDSDEPEEEEDDEGEDPKARKVSPSSSSSLSSPFSSTAGAKKPPQQDEVLMRQQKKVPLSYAAHMRQRLGSFKSRSYSLADLQEHDEEEEDSDD